MQCSPSIQIKNLIGVYPMAAVTENDLKELKDLITAGFAKSDANQSRLEASLNDLKIEMARIEATMQAQSPYIQKIPDLAEKVGELKNWKQIGVIIATAFISSALSGSIGGVIGWLIRK